MKALFAWLAFSTVLLTAALLLRSCTLPEQRGVLIMAALLGAETLLIVRVCFGGKR